MTGLREPRADKPGAPRLIRRSPTQYLWYHRRLKTRPAGEAVPYRKKRRELREEARLRQENRK